MRQDTALSALAQFSRSSAQEIAGDAQAFGQEDDITVLTLQFAPA
jgi:hypothetical protein